MKKFASLLLVAFASQAFAVSHLYVSPDGSDETGSGGAGSPYKTLSAATRAVAKSKDKEVYIHILSGEHFIKDTMDFSGDAFRGKKIFIKGKLGKDAKKPRLIGGTKIPVSALKKVVDKEILKKTPADAEGTLYSIDLKKYGITDCGKMQQRGFADPRNTTQMEAFLDGNPMTLAQYPNSGEFMPIGEMIDGGYIARIAAGQGAFKPKADKVKRGATFKYSDPRHARWVNAPDAYISGYPSVGWAYDEIKIKSIDANKGTLTLASPHIYGVYSNLPQKFEKDDPARLAYGFDKCMRGYKVINLLEELDADGEYYIDRENCVFYAMFKNKPAPETPIYFSSLDKPFIKISKQKDIRIENLDFSCSRAVAIHVGKSENIFVDDCDIHSCARAATFVNGKRNRLNYCNVYDIAYSAVSMSGGDRKTLEKSNNQISNCRFYNNARVIPCSSSAVSMSGVGIRLSNCEFKNHPHVTVRHQGNDMLIEFNSFENCGIKSSDMGIVYTGRDQSCQGNIIRHNFFTENLAPHPNAMMCGVYVDDGSAGQLIERNVFCRTGNMGRSVAFGAIYVHGGCDNIAQRNVFIECDSGISQQEWTDEKYGAALKREAHKFYKNVDVNSDIYKKRYPKLADQLTANYPRVNYAEHNRVYDTSISMNGKVHLKRNKKLKLNEGVTKADVLKIKVWTLDDVRRCFGKDEVCAKAISLPIGVKEKVKK